MDGLTLMLFGQGTTFRGMNEQGLEKTVCYILSGFVPQKCSSSARVLFSGLSPLLVCEMRESLALQICLSLNSRMFQSFKGSISKTYQNN